MILNPWRTIRRLRADLESARAERACTERLLADAQRKLAAGGRARGARHHDLVMAKAAELGMHVVRNA